MLAIGRGVEGAAAALAVPDIDVCLQAIALGEQLAIDRREADMKIGQTASEMRRRDARAGQCAMLDELRQRASHGQLVALNSLHATQIDRRIHWCSTRKPSF